MNLKKEWGSHLPVLIKMMSITDGDVLELGTGFYSTSFLHYACLMANRKLVSYDYQEKYYKLMKGYGSDLHTVAHVPNWDKLDFQKNWDIAFIDHDPAERRIKDIEKLANFAKYVIVHDTSDKVYDYDKVFSLFKYRYDYKGAFPHTTILSNFVPLTNFKI